MRSVESFKAAVTDAMQGNELTTIIAKVEAKGPPPTSPTCRCWRIGFNSAGIFSRLRSAISDGVRTALKRTWSVGRKAS